MESLMESLERICFYVALGTMLAWGLAFLALVR